MAGLKAYKAKLEQVISDFEDIKDEAIYECQHEYAKANSKQLFEGIDSNGNKLKPYAESTIKKKKRTNQITSKTILNDYPNSEKGNFHNEMFGEYEGGVLKISSDTDYTRYLVENYGSDIFGLKNANRRKVSRSKVMPLFTAKLKQRL